MAIIEPDSIGDRLHSTKQRAGTGFLLVLFLALVGCVILYVCLRAR
jgi:hypothetical protein